MMRRRTVTWAGVGLVLAVVGGGSVARAEYLDRDQLMAEARRNKALARYIKVNGLPDVAERLPITDEPPWDDHQIVVDYFGTRKEISFARARVLGSPSVHTRRYERVLTDADIRRLSTHGSLRDGSTPACDGNCAAHPGCPHGQAS